MPVPTSPAEVKQRGRWLLHEGREQLLRGNYDIAQQKADEARTLDIHWGLFDDTPDKLEQEIAKTRPQVPAGQDMANANLLHDRRTAKARLQEARKLLDGGQYEQAESLALEVKSWGLSYSMFEDNPDKLTAAARRVRRRDKVRKLPAREQAGQAVYDELVQTSRHLLEAGRLDEADRKARQALSMDVYPGLNSDRAENVLHDVEMARANTRLQSPAAPASPGVGAGLAVAPAEPSSAGLPLAAANAAPATDPAVQRSSGTAGEFAPALAAPADNDPPGMPPGPPPQAAVATAPALEAAPAPPAEAPAPPGNRGEQLLAEAKALYASGNFRAARDMAGQAKVRGLRRRCPGRRADRPDRPGRAGRGARPLRGGPRRHPQGRLEAGPGPAHRGRRRRRLAR